MTRLDSALRAVAVYPDRARVTRQGSLSLEPGAHRLEVSGLPLKLDPSSVRAAAHSTAQARLLGVQVKQAFEVEPQVEQIRELEAQVEALQDELRGLDAEAELAKASRSTLSALAGHTQIFATALAAGEMSVADQLAIFDGLRKRSAVLDAELQALAVRRREVERRLQKAKNELDSWRGTPRREHYVVEVEVEIFAAGELTLDLTYVVMGAGWQPLYDLRLQEENESSPTLAVDYLAQVIQRTGEAWDEVALTLSTARPAMAGRLPELAPWYIGPFPPIQPRMEGGPMMAMAAMAAPAAEPRTLKKRSMESARDEVIEAEVVVARVDSSGAAVTYHIPGLVSIPADGAPHKVSVAHFPLKPRMDYVTAPRLVEAVYRRAQVTNNSPYTLLPGQVSLFAGEEFIGALPLDLIAPGQEIELFLGADDRVQVKRELKRREVDKRLIGGKRVLHYGYEITLENLLPREVKIRLQDQIPVARHEDIKVRLESAEPRPAEQSELNLLAWDIMLATKAKQVVRFDFNVEYPVGMEVTGLV